MFGGGSAQVRSPRGRLLYSNTMSSARAFTLDNGTLSVAGARTLTLNGATVAGGFLTGPGARVGLERRQRRHQHVGRSSRARLGQQLYE